MSAVYQSRQVFANSFSLNVWELSDTILKLWYEYQCWYAPSV